MELYNMFDMRFLTVAFVILLLLVANEVMKRCFSIDIGKVDVFSWLKPSKKNDEVVVTRTTGDKSLIMTDAGVNKATVMATLRQITGIDYNSAKQVVEHIPSKFMVNVSEKEADLTKEALEFVGAKVEIK
jgi:ribosomal protein L7/L12